VCRFQRCAWIHDRTCNRFPRNKGSKRSLFKRICAYLYVYTYTYGHLGPSRCCSTAPSSPYSTHNLPIRGTFRGSGTWLPCCILHHSPSSTGRGGRPGCLYVCSMCVYMCARMFVYVCVCTCDPTQHAIVFQDTRCRRKSPLHWLVCLYMCMMDLCYIYVYMHMYIHIFSDDWI